MVEWNSGMVERWSTERAINDPVPFYLYKWANWACALAIGMAWLRGYLLLENYRHLVECFEHDLV